MLNVSISIGRNATLKLYETWIYSGANLQLMQLRISCYNQLTYKHIIANYLII